MDNYTNLSHDQQYALLDAQTAGGQTVRAFCAERGIKESRFYTWRNRRRKRSTGGENRAAFVPIQTTDAGELRLRLAGGLVLRFAADQLELAAELLLQMDRRGADL